MSVPTAISETSAQMIPLKGRADLRGIQPNSNHKDPFRVWAALWGTQVGLLLLGARRGWSLAPGPGRSLCRSQRVSLALSSQVDRPIRVALRFYTGRLMPFAIFFIGDCFDASFSSRASFRSPPHRHANSPTTPITWNIALPTASAFVESSPLFVSV